MRLPATLSMPVMDLNVNRVTGWLAGMITLPV